MNDIITKGEIKAIKSVQAMDDFKLLLEFSNKEKRIFDVKLLFDKPVFQPLKNKELFEKVHIIYDYTIAWNDEIDMCPDSLYLDSVPFDRYII
jgi:hypothetical protein